MNKSLENIRGFKMTDNTGKQKLHPEYSQAVSGDGVVIMKDGIKMTADEIVWQLNHYANGISNKAKEIERLKDDIQQASSHLDDSWADNDWMGVERVLLRFDEVLNEKCRP